MIRLIFSVLLLVAMLPEGSSQMDYEIGMHLNRDFSYRILRTNAHTTSISRVQDKEGEAPKWNYGGGFSTSVLIKDNLRITLGLRYADFGYTTTKQNALHTFLQIEPDARRYQAEYSFQTIIPSVIVEQSKSFGKVYSLTYGGGLISTVLFHEEISQNYSFDTANGGRGRSSSVGSSNLRYIPGIALTGSLERQFFNRFFFYLRTSYNLSLIALDQTFYRERPYNLSIETGVRLRIFSTGRSNNK